MQPDVTGQVLAFYRDHFDLNSLQIQSLGNAGGFSGSQLWKLTSFDRHYCLRRWPAGTELPKINRIHRIQTLAAGLDCPFVPVPLPSASQFKTVVEFGSFAWHVEPWMPGRADYFENPNKRRLANAFKSLARFHLAVRQEKESSQGPCPAVWERAAQLKKLINGEIDHITAACLRSNLISYHPVARQLSLDVRRLGPQLLSDLLRLERLPVPLASCLRDVWHDHILFIEDEVSGLIDFGAMRIDSRTVDLSRLLGSLCGNESTDWRLALNEYQSSSPLSEDELALIPVLDRATVLLSLSNWLRWLFVENRQFENQTSILPRLLKLCGRAQSF